MKLIQIGCFLLIITNVFLAGCSSGDAETAKDYYYPETQNILFFGTQEITLEITQNVSQPSFGWDATGLKYVVITIFSSKIDLKQNQISNTKDAVWTWNTGMGKGREGNVSFSDGRDIHNSIIQETVTPLKPGVYYIAAWVYDDSYNLTHSSKEYRFEYNSTL